MEIKHYWTLALEIFKTLNDLNPTYIQDLFYLRFSSARPSNNIRPGRVWAWCDQMGELDNYTFLEFSDHVDNIEKLFFFVTFGATSFQQQFSKDSKRHITDIIFLIYWYIRFLVSTYVITVCSVKFVFNWNLNILNLLLF